MAFILDSDIYSLNIQTCLRVEFLKRYGSTEEYFTILKFYPPKQKHLSELERKIFHVQNASIKIVLRLWKISICLRCFSLHVSMLPKRRNFAIRFLVSYYFQHKIASLNTCADEWGNLYSRNSFMHEIILENFQKFLCSQTKLQSEN